MGDQFGTGPGRVPGLPAPLVDLPVLAQNPVHRGDRPDVEALVQQVTRQTATSPAESYQFFGEVEIDGHSRDLTVRLRDLTGTQLWTTTLVANG